MAERPDLWQLESDLHAQGYGTRLRGGRGRGRPPGWPGLRRRGDPTPGVGPPLPQRLQTGDTPPAGRCSTRPSPRRPWPGPWLGQSRRRSTPSTSSRPGCWPWSGPSKACPSPRTWPSSTATGITAGCITAPNQTVVKGDSKSASIAAASILAKVSRDRHMVEMDRQYPQYGFAQHKGYGTKLHYERLRQYGPCPIHRKTFLTKL